MMWGVNLCKKAADQLKQHCALTPSLEALGWRDLSTAPHDGAEISLRVVHINAAFDDPVKAAIDGWIAHCRGKWSDHNGGGWTWYGLCGSPCQWRPIQ